MARLYSAFSNTTTNNPGPSYTRVPYGDGIQNYASDRAQLVSDRQALNDDFMASVESVNRSGALGLYVPLSTLSFDGINGQASNLYKILPNVGASAQLAGHPGRPRINLLTTDGAALSPADPVIFTKSVYDQAQANIDAFVNARTGFWSLAGANPTRSWLTFELDADIRYFYWDNAPSWLIAASAAVFNFGTSSGGTCLTPHENRILWGIQSQDNSYYRVDIDWTEDETNWQSLVIDQTLGASNYVHQISGIFGSTGDPQQARYRVKLVRRDNGGVVMWLTTNLVSWNADTCVV